MVFSIISLTMRLSTLHQLLVGDLGHRGELVRRQAMQLVAGIPYLDLQVGILRAGEFQGLPGQLLDQVEEVVGLNGEGAVLHAPPPG